jgi:aryl-alcohol dehydrogenase-like predicted oxidoreductase
MVGAMLREFTRREETVVATKVFYPVDGSGPNQGGLSRKAVFQEIDASLKRLAMDYVDLYQIHRWDYGTPIEETMEALHDVVKSGKARYIGASSMFAWQFSKAQHVAERNGWTRFSTMQNHLNLLYREEEREMLPLCLDQGVGVIPWSPLARGTLARAWQQGTDRSSADTAIGELYGATTAADRKVVEAVGEVAEKRGVPRAQVALAWLMQKSAVIAPIIGVTKPQHLDDAVAALELSLEREEIERLERDYVPHAVAGAL